MTEAVEGNWWEVYCFIPGAWKLITDGASSDCAAAPVINTTPIKYNTAYAAISSSQRAHEACDELDEFSLAGDACLTE